MSLNLHAAVRSVIPAVNADIPGYWYRSKGSIIAANGRQQPAFYDAVPVLCQVQPPSGMDIKFLNYLQMQGEIRSVWMFSDPGQINRVNQVGNDLVLFPQWPGAPNDVWLVAKVDEGWGVDDGGWTKFFARLQTDRAYSIYDSSGQLVLDSNGIIVTQS